MAIYQSILHCGNDDVTIGEPAMKHFEPFEASSNDSYNTQLQKNAHTYAFLTLLLSYWQKKNDDITWLTQPQRPIIEEYVW
jgi:hypothetical protein